MGLAAVTNADDLGEAVDLAADELDVVAVHADGHHFQAARLRRFDHLPGIAIVDIDHRRAAWHDQIREQPQLGLQIGFHGRMVVEMVARQIGEGAGGDTHAVKPVLIEPVRGGFQRQMGDAFAGQLIERAVQFDRVGRRQRAVFFALRRYHADGADARGHKSERGPDLPGKGRNRGLAAGAGDGADGRRLPWVKFRRGQRQRAARIGHRHEGDAFGQSFRPLLGGNRHRASGCRGAGEMRAVGLGAGDGDKQKARFHLAAVGGNSGDIDAGCARIDFCFRQ